MTGPGITSEYRVPRRETLTTTSSIDERFGNMSNDLVVFDVEADVEYAVIDLDGVARISWAGEHERSFVDSGVRYCFLEDCLCPDGRPPFDGASYEQLPRGMAWLGLGGFATRDTKVAVDDLTQDEVCEPCEAGAGGGLRASGSSGLRSPR